MPLPLFDINDKPAENLAGMNNSIYFGYVNDAESIPAKHTSTTGVATDGKSWLEISELPVMATGKKMYQLKATKDTVKLTHEAQGENDGKSFKNQLEFAIPGLEKESLALAAITNNADMFFIVSSGGKYYLFGNKERPATSEGASGGSGSKAADAKNTTFKYTFDWSTPTPIIVLTEANIETLLTAAAAA